MKIDQTMLHSSLLCTFQSNFQLSYYHQCKIKTILIRVTTIKYKNP
jgi:hypothetical protein